MDAADRIRQAARLDAIEGRFDRLLLGAALALACIGIVMVASASIAIAEGLGVGSFYFVGRHALFIAVGGVLAYVLMRSELKDVERYSQLCLLLSVAALLAVFLPGLGKEVNGARRWLNLGVSNFQAVEAVKLMFIVWLSSYLVRNRDEIGHSWKALLKPLGATGLIVLILLAQPDFGSGLLLLSIAGGLLLLGGANLPRLLGLAAGGLVLVALVAIAEPYRVRRLTSFLNPWEDPFADGFQLTQALIAVGRGEFFGVGLGGSVQKLFYLPEAHTDFIMAVIAEELGFIGVVAVLALFAVVVWRAFSIGLRCIDMRRPFAGYSAFGIGLWIGLQTFVSVGVNLGLLPTKGLTLPLISSGGSSVMMTCVAFGLLLRVSYELDRAERQVARVRGEETGLVRRAAAAAPAPDFVPSKAPLPVAASTAVVRGPRGSRARIEPTLGAV
ncbi:MAG TPA: putative lipid II flippase FtsW [Arenimonas sp.]|nr:putative lipid II flippase FtsW [Arenimonas sp.]